MSMKTLYKFLTLSFIIVIFASCNSSYKSYKQGNYYKACIEAIDKLRSKPKDEKAQMVLTKAYPLAQQLAQREINNALLRNDVNNYETIVYQYDLLNKLAQNIYTCPKALELIPQPAEYQAELTDAKMKAAEQAYNMGDKAFDAGTIEQSRLAYQYYQKANSFYYGYKDVLTKMEDALYESTLRVAFEKPKTSLNYQLSADFFSDNLMSEISKYFQSRMIRFYTQYGTGANSDRPHQYLVLNFEDFSIGNVHDTKNTTEVKRDSVKVGTATIDGKKVDVYNTVSAKITTNVREIISRGVLSVRIYDANNNLIQQKNFTGQYVWSTSWGNFNGDERALTTEQKNICNRDPQLPPSPQDMFVEFTKPIYTQASAYIKSFYSRY